MSTDSGVGLLIEQIMEEHELSEDQLSNSLGISRSYLNLIKHGKRKCSDHVAISLQKNFGISQSIIDPLRKEYDKNDASGKLIAEWTQKRYGLLVNSEIIAAHRAELLAISGIQVKNIKPCGYDLSIGSIIYPDKKLLERADCDSSYFEIPPFQMITAQSAESIKLSQHIYGSLDKTSESFKEYDIVVEVGGRIHPGWEGEIIFRLTNNRNEPARVDWSALLIGVQFQFLPRTPEKDVLSLDTDFISDNELLAKLEEHNKTMSEQMIRSQKFMQEIKRRGLDAKNN